MATDFTLHSHGFEKFKNLGLVEDYKNKESQIGFRIRSTFGLKFLSPQEVSLCFVEYFMSIILDDIRVNQYSGYLLDTYLSEGTKFTLIFLQIYDLRYCELQTLENIFTHNLKKIFMKKTKYISLAKYYKTTSKRCIL